MQNFRSIEADDPEMAQAIAAARASIGDFFDAFEHPKAGQHGFLLKVRFATEERAEHIWVADLDFSSNPARGLVANETRFPGLSYRQQVQFTPDQITDWMYFQDGDLVGAFTTRLLISRQRQIN